MVVLHRRSRRWVKERKMAIFFYHAAATSEVSTILFVGSVRCVYGTGDPPPLVRAFDRPLGAGLFSSSRRAPPPRPPSTVNVAVHGRSLIHIFEPTRPY